MWRFYVAWVRRKLSGGLWLFSIWNRSHFNSFHLRNRNHLEHFPFGIRGVLTLEFILFEIQGQPGKLLRPPRTRRGGVLGSVLEPGETFHQPRKLGFRLCCARPLRSHLQVQEGACSHQFRSHKSSIPFTSILTTFH